MKYAAPFWRRSAAQRESPRRRNRIMKVDILYFDGCPHYKPALDRVREVLKEEGISADVSETHIADATAARASGFLGSPSIRVNGLDVEPAARSWKEFGMMC